MLRDFFNLLFMLVAYTLVDRFFGGVIMQKCPICGEGIDYLNFFTKEEVMAVFGYNEEFNNWDNIGIAEGAKTNFCCPECAEILFNNEEEAKEFLKSGVLPEHRIPHFVERKLSQ